MAGVAASSRAQDPEVGVRGGRGVRGGAVQKQKGRCCNDEILWRCDGGDRGSRRLMCLPVPRANP